MAENQSPGFGVGDLLGAIGANNPLTSLTRSVAQFQRGVNDFLTTVENVNTALEQFNQVSARVNRLLDLVEEPMKAFVPQVTRTIRAADDLVDRLSTPVDRVAPGLTRLADTLSSPVLTALPKDLNEFLGTLRDLAKRMRPLGQMAETAGGLFSRGPFAQFLGVPAKPEPTPAPAPKAIEADRYDDDDDDDDIAPRRATLVSRTPAKKKAAAPKQATKRASATAKTGTAKRAEPRR
jgi:ABC-type transporter Mla subunit MlaD